MSATIIATPGAIDANSFQTVEEIDAYYQTRVPATVRDQWLDADAEDKIAAAIMATMVMSSHIRWTGFPTSLTQLLPWPRNSMWDRSDYASVPTNVIPRELKNAHAELARVLLLSDRTIESDAAREGLTFLKAGPISMNFKTNTPDSPNVIPDFVINLLVPSWIAWVVDQNGIERELRRA